MKDIPGLNFEGTTIPLTSGSSPSDVNRTRLVMFAPTAEGVKKGQEFIEKIGEGAALIACKHQVMLPEAWQNISTEFKDNSIEGKKICAACIVRPGIDGAKDISLLPKTLVVHVNINDMQQTGDILNQNTEHWWSFPPGQQVDWFQQWGLAV